MIAPATQGALKPCAWPMPIKAIPIVAMVVHELPVMTDTTAHKAQQAARKRSVCIT